MEIWNDFSNEFGERYSVSTYGDVKRKDYSLKCGKLVAVKIFGWEYFHKKEIVSNVRLTPEIKLRTDGKKIDTLFIYKSK